MQVPVGCGRRGLLLASSSLVALLIGGGAPSAYAACLTQNGGTVASVSNSSATGNCILVENSALVTGNVSNTSTGVLTANGGAPPTSTGITITNSTIDGTVTNSGTIKANAQGILVEDNAAVLGGISNSGTVSASLFGLIIGGSVASTTVSTFGGGITNSGTISSANRAAIAIGGGLLSGSQSIVVSNFSGGISNSGAVLSTPLAVMVGGEAEKNATVTVSTFSGGITNGDTGTIQGGDGILVGGEAFTNAQVAVSSFGGGISNAGTISSKGATGAGVLVGGAATGSASVAVSTFSGGISNSGLISGPFGVIVGFSITENATGTLSTFSEGITNSGTGTIEGSKYGIFIGGIANGTNAQATLSTFSGGISNAGTLSGGNGIFIGGTGSGRTTLSTFSGGITNSGSIGGNRGIFVGGVVDGGQVTISNFSGGISNSGTGTISGILVGGTAFGGGAVTISTFSGGITNSGTVLGASDLTGSNGIVVGGRVTAGHITISTFTGGITNAGNIAAATAGIVVGAGSTIPTFSGNISNAGLITAATGIIVASNSTIGGAIVDSGTILAASHAIDVGAASTINASHTAILVSGPTLTGGIASAGTISAANVGIRIGSGVAISTFSGNIGNSGRITAATGILVEGNSTINGAIADSGTILASNHGIAVDTTSTINASHTGVVVSGATLTGGISNAGTISAASGRGVLIGSILNIAGGSSIFRTTTVPTFAGGISNAGTITAQQVGIMVGGKATISATSMNHATITISTFAGGIANSGMISTGGTGLLVGGTATATGHSDTASVTVSNFSGGISNSGTIAAAGAGIEAGGAASTSRGGAAFVTISTFSNGITNSGIIDATTGIVVNSHVSTFSGVIANSGTISAGGGTAIDVSSANNAITIDQSGGSISGAIKLSAHADALNISGGTIGGDIVGAGSSDTVNFNMAAGTFTYGSAYGFTGINQVDINSGTVILNGANNADAIDVIGGTLAGAGTLDPLTLTIHSGATFAPGTPGVPGTSMIITGNLAFQSGALYVIYLDLATTFANVSGTASLTGTVNANFTSGGGLAKQYTILESLGLGGTTFSGLTSSGLPASFTPALGYSADDVFVNLTAMLATGTPLAQNQQNVANAIDGYFNNGGALPASFINLFNLNGAPLANALSQLDGEAATDASKGAFQLMTDFLDLMLDPTGGGGASGGGGGASGFANEDQAGLPPDVALAYARALHQKPAAAAAAQTFDQRWSVWGSAYGGTNRTDGNAAVGSNNVNASDFGFAGGMTYHVTPMTDYGFALAGGGTNWSLAQSLGSGRSDAFQAGVYGTTHFGPGYVSAALAFANNWFTTNRIALGDQLTAKFDGQSYAARLEAGYRYGLPVTGYIIGVTPYAALQAQDFHTPGYSETDLTGGGFGLSYNAMNATDTRSELGARFDDLTMFNAMPLVLRGRLAWAHDWVSGAALGAAFQSLPGSSFTVNGAAVPQNSALATAAAELHLTANWTAMAKFDGEFAPTSQTYAGTGTLRYSW
ncbi:MAG: autotransporter domain-containing protein [Xanthobacteraceae bacterium]